MRGLRARLGLTLVASMVPFALLVGWAERALHERAVVSTVAREISMRMEDGGLDLCEARPESFPFGGRRRRRPPRGRAPIYAYDADTLRSHNPDAPELPDELAARLGRGEDPAVHAVGLRERRLLVAVRVADGPCGIVVAERPHRHIEGARSIVVPALVSAFAVLIAVLAAGPLVRRIRRLTRQVQDARTGGGQIVVEGNDEIAQLAEAFASDRRALQSQMQALEQRDIALKEYIANTTHDVMLPLTVLQGHLVALRRRLPSEELEPLDLALEESHYLGALLHNLSAAARLDAFDELVLGPVDLVDLVERVVARNAPIARQKEVSLDHAVPEGELWAHGDRTLLERAIGNVVHNAVRHNREGGHVAVILEARGDAFELTVVDDGPGVSDEELTRLGTRHQRGGAARTRHPSGMGLGLAITRDVAERHAIELQIERVPPPEHGLRVRLHGKLQRTATTPYAKSSSA